VKEKELAPLGTSTSTKSSGSQQWRKGKDDEEVDEDEEENEDEEKSEDDLTLGR
jgi:ribosomal protein L12E/L44/L45/RPP1/RPP2